jgi:hypothetical protein
MDSRTYQNTTNKQFNGTRVRTKRALSNGYFTIPVGAVCTILKKYNGFEIETDPCGTCGVKVRVSRVPHQAVEAIL